MEPPAAELAHADHMAKPHARFVPILNPYLVCPHCQVKRKVKTQHVKVKAGVSGGKATAALLTGGVSLVATGLARKDELAQATCGNCQMTWRP